MINRRTRNYEHTHGVTYIKSFPNAILLVRAAPRRTEMRWCEHKTHKYKAIVAWRRSADLFKYLPAIRRLRISMLPVARPWESTEKRRPVSSCHYCRRHDTRAVTKTRNAGMTDSAYVARHVPNLYLLAVPICVPDGHLTAHRVPRYRYHTHTPKMCMFLSRRACEM